MKKFFLALSAILMAACAGQDQTQQKDQAVERQKASSTRIGCDADEIAIVGTGATMWAARCRGKEFECTAHPTPVCIEKR